MGWSLTHNLRAGMKSATFHRSCHSPDLFQNYVFSVLYVSLWLILCACLRLARREVLGRSALNNSLRAGMKPAPTHPRSIVQIILPTSFKTMFSLCSMNLCG